MMTNVISSMLLTPAALESVQEIIYDDPLELCIIQGEENDGDDPIRVEQVAHLEATEFMIWKKKFEEIDRGKEKR
ncbi:unnamed protein product [Dovyalis caffra]|uniref:Uncharacterized protein n=1 Tax=Dovyalis caffra TaxID=77055 RepID=A0AAV1SUF6_9ROSI|nr:unnamed protein product [Dovyalis caffra]